MIVRQYRAGQSVEDYCRQCKEDRIHTVIVVDGQAQPLRVTCDFCRSEHNYRGGPRMTPVTQMGGPRSVSTSSAPHKGAPYDTRRNAPDTNVPTERRVPLDGAPNANTETNQTFDGPDMANDFETIIRRIIREETGLTSVAPAEKWRGGQLVLRPGKPGVQEKAWPIETFFNKVVMLRNRLRTLEQQVNASELPDDQKLKLQAYITGCYGSLTSFNVLFADEDDRFVGSGE